MTDTEKLSPENGLRRGLDVEIVQNLLEVAELRGEMRASLQAINDKIDRLLALQEKVERNAQAIARLKTIWSFVAAGIALVVAALKDWLFGQK
jgi:type VI protein secretion system component VasF